MSAAELVNLSDHLSPAEPQFSAALESWFVYIRVLGRRRGAYVGPFNGPDAAIAHLRDVVEMELLLFDTQVRSSSTFRIMRRARRRV